MSRRGQGALDLSADRARALQLTPVSVETQLRLDVFVALLLHWQRKINLVAQSTLPLLWTRHIADSLQLVPLAPQARVWVDFGSGAGFPGVPIACALAENTETTVHLVESNGKKAAFLREVARELKLRAEIHGMRAEIFGDSWKGRADAVTARALAPLNTLCNQARPLIARGAVGLFLKGQDVGAELTEAAKYWTVQAERVPSRTDPAASVVIVRDLKPKTNRRRSEPDLP